MDIEKARELSLERQANAEVQVEAIRQMQAKAEVEMERIREAQEKANVEHDRQIAKINRTLDRAITLGIREARNERRRRQEMDARFDDKITQLAAAQLVTEEKLQSLIDSQRRSGNGHA